MGARHTHIAPIGILGKVAFATFAIVSFISCDWESRGEVYIENLTSSDCIVYTVRNPKSKSKNDTLVINHGDRVLLYKTYWFDEWASDWMGRQMIRDDVKRVFSGGITIKYENGDSLTYYPDSIKSQTNSPYDENSYQYQVVDKWEVHAIYVISEVD